MILTRKRRKRETEGDAQRSHFSLFPLFRVLTCVFLLPLSAQANEWRSALPGWLYEFPRDHGSHPGFKTEWWYFTGNLATKDGREFGYQLTFFRQGVSPDLQNATSRFVTRDLKFAHFAITDLGSGKFLFGQALSRGAFGEAGFSDGPRLAWIDGHSLELRSDGSFHLVGRDAEKSLDLTLRPSRSPVIHGESGLSRKGDGEGRASQYYSHTRLETTGAVSIGGESWEVAGSSWFDHEWATNQLGADQAGWDWFSLQFEDGSELMLFQLRKKTGGRDRWSGGTWVAPNGSQTRISNDDFTLEPSGFWKSPGTAASYPLQWRIRVPKLDLDIDVVARMPDQELRLKPVVYWEGVVKATGRDDKRRGVGYLEMTGYAGRVVGLSESE
jgi:predicted secreted hydrolase